MNGSTIVYVAGFVAVALVAWGLYTGTLQEWLGLAKVKTQKATKDASTPAEKARMKINQLTPMLEQLGQQMTDLDGKFGRTSGELTRAKAALETAKGEARNVLETIAAAQGITVDEAKTSTTLTADQAQTRQKHAQAVAAAKALVEAKQGELAGISEQATKLHEQYSEAEGQVNTLKAQLPAIEARSIVIASKQTAVDFANKMKAFNDAASTGADVNADLDEAEAKVDAELGRAGATKTETEKAAAKRKADANTADALKDI